MSHRLGLVRDVCLNLNSKSHKEIKYKVKTQNLVNNSIDGSICVSGADLQKDV